MSPIPSRTSGWRTGCGTGSRTALILAAGLTLVPACSPEGTGPERQSEPPAPGFTGLADSTAVRAVGDWVMGQLRPSIAHARGSGEVMPLELALPDEGDSVAWEGLRVRLTESLRARPVLPSDTFQVTIRIQELRASADTLVYFIKFASRRQCPDGRRYTGGDTSWVIKLSRSPTGWVFAWEDEPAWGSGVVCLPVIGGG